MKNKNLQYDILAFTAIFVFVLSLVGIAWWWISSKQVREDVPTLEAIRIEAPKAAETERAEETSEPETTEAVIEAAEPAEEIPLAIEVAPVPEALELMYDTPLRAEVQLEIEAMCAARDVDAAVVLAMIYHESRYIEDAIGDSCNSYGLMQIQPRWHAERMKRLGVTDLLDGVQNVTVGIDYLDELLDRYGGDYSKALTAYNRGHYNGTVTQYAIKVLEEAERMEKDVH